MALTEGTYAAQLVQNDGVFVQFGRAGKDGDGKPRALLTFEIFDGSRVQENFWLSPDAISYTMDKLHTCGFEGDDLRAMKTQAPHGKVELVIKEEEYKGKRQLRIVFINPQGGFSIKKQNRLSDNELDEISEMAKPADSGAGADGDDIRF